MPSVTGLHHVVYCSDTKRFAVSLHLHFTCHTLDDGPHRLDILHGGMLAAKSYADAEYIPVAAV